MPVVRLVTLVIGIAGFPIQGFAAEVIKNRSGRPVGLLLADDNVARIVSEIDMESKSQIRWVQITRGSVFARDIVELAKLTGLESLVIGEHPDSVRLNEGVLKALSQNATIKRVSVFGEFVVKQDLSILAEMQQLVELELGHKTIVDTSDLESLGKILKLKKLSVDCCLDLSDFGWINRLSKLESLSLSAESIDQVRLKAMIPKSVELKVDFSK